MIVAAAECAGKRMAVAPPAARARAGITGTERALGRVVHALTETHPHRDMPVAVSWKSSIAIATAALLSVMPYRRRLEEEVARDRSRPAAPVDDGLARRARNLLEQRLGEVAASPDTPPVPAAFDIPPRVDPARDKAVTRVQQLLWACKDCGALSADELSEWRRRLREVDAGRTWSLERERRQQSCTLAELLAVVPGAATRDRRIRVTTAELYADGVVLRWHEHPASARERPAFRDPKRPALGPARGEPPGRRYVCSATTSGQSTCTFTPRRSTLAGMRSCGSRGSRPRSRPRRKSSWQRSISGRYRSGRRGIEAARAFPSSIRTSSSV